jgi:hypothetical protein
MAALEQDQHLRQAELNRQRNMIDWLCYYRPLCQLTRRWRMKIAN